MYRKLELQELMNKVRNYETLVIHYEYLEMTNKQAIHLFEGRKVRTLWDDEHEKWCFFIVDVW